MAYIGKKPEDLIRGNATYNAFTGDGSTTTFDVTNLLPDGGAFDVEVFVDNVRQEAGSSKSYTIGQDGSGDLKRVTFNTAPDDGAEIYVINPGRETSIITVADDVVTTAKLNDGAVTTAKLGADAVTGAKIADDAINSEHITDGSVDNVHLAGSIANSKLANSSITINGTAVALGGSVTAGTEWQAVTVADGSTQLTAEAGKGYFLDTNTGVIEVLLPTSPSRGDTIILADYGGNFATNNVIVNAGSNLIDSVETAGLSQGYKLTTNNLVVELVFVDTNKGWQIIENESKSSLTAADDTNAAFTEATGGTITTSGNFKIHTFTGDANFVVSKVGNAGGGGSTVDYMVVAGGGAGNGVAGSGAGAGGFRASNDTCMPSPQTSPLASPTGITITATTFPVTVGGGGSAPPTNASPAPNGSNSVFSTITSAGGGASVAAGNPGINGGSGSGGGGENPGSVSAAGSGNTPPVSPPQGQNGGTGGQAPSHRGAGGGGGAGAAGTNGDADGGPGGIGSYMLQTGFAGCNGEPGPVSGARYFAGGGGGGYEAQSGSNGVGGVGGGGDAGPGPGTSPGNGQNAVANTGGGGGGGSRGAPGTNAGQTGGNGGKGIVIIRYKFQ